MLGSLGLPHILMRLFTVSNVRAAKASVFYAASCISLFYIFLIVIGFGAMAFVTGNPDYVDSAGTVNGGSNMIAIHIAHYVGGDLLMGFISAVAFATILAVVAGLVIAGSASISHDLYAELMCNRKPKGKKELFISRITALVIGIIALVMGLLFQHQNIAFLSTMAMVVSATVTFPALFLVLFWRGLTTRGLPFGVVIGFFSSLILTVLGPNVWVGVLGYDSPAFPYDYPALFTVPLAFLGLWFFFQ